MYRVFFSRLRVIWVLATIALVGFATMQVACKDCEPSPHDKTPDGPGGGSSDITCGHGLRVKFKNLAGNTLLEEAEGRLWVCARGACDACTVNGECSAAKAQEVMARRRVSTAKQESVPFFARRGIVMKRDWEIRMLLWDHGRVFKGKNIGDVTVDLATSPWTFAQGSLEGTITCEP